jgi:alkanesulfonate monooxygenase SsuD/methylene tetrahydromethanopterin reductase-like flavin-dependent oxidoreductase (luciferase family)
MIRFGIHIPNFGHFGEPSAVVEIAQTAERGGWDGLFIWDHIRWEHDRSPVVDPWIALAAAAQATETLRLGTMITPLARRRPWKLARETVSLDRLSGGRVIFGAGLGWGKDFEFAAFGDEADDRARAAMLDEGLAVMTGLWSGSPFSFSGEHFRAENVTFLPRPVQAPRIPIWIAGLWPNPRPFRRAARWDGVFPERLAGGTVSAAEVAEINAYVRSHRTSEEPFDIAVGGYSHRSIEYDKQFGAYEDSGLTWWFERLDPSRQLSPEDTFELVASGPPREGGVEGASGAGGEEELSVPPSAS